MPRGRKIPKPEPHIPGLSAPAPMASTAATPANGGTSTLMVTPAPKRQAQSSSARTPTRAAIFFWGERNARTGYLSQWYDEVPFYDPLDTEAKIYKTAEHYMMHHKALLFGDVMIAADILEAGHPRRAKDLGRAVQGFDEEVWIAERERIVRRASWCKFTCPVETDSNGLTEDKVWKLGKGPDAKEVRAASFRRVLLNTGDRELVEASPADRIWGIGYRGEDAEQNRETWGLNLLGKALMAVREEFRKEDAVHDASKGAA